MEQGIVAFPPRNEPNAFFTNLQALYRDYLKRSQTAMSYVDPEGENVWLTEYFRFYLNGCSHAEATSRTLSEIRTGTTFPVCGGESLVFPPRNLPNEFQAALEATYHEILGRSQSAYYVDSEGANVWLAEYLRYRVAGNCNHAEAESKVFAQIQGQGVQPICGGTTISDTVQAFDWDMWDFTVGGSGSRQIAIGLSWSSSSDDLDLYLTSGNCELYPPLYCNILQSSRQSTGTSEYITFAARGGDHFHVWVDNFELHPVTYFLTSWNAPGFAAVQRDADPVFSAGPVSRGHKPADAKKIR
jgi:hypothetical protein